jgi:DNA-binding NarL/FixJ family response regulator
MDDVAAHHDPRVERFDEPAPTTYVVAPHLLVAQAVAAALRSPTVRFRAASWENVFGPSDAAAHTVSGDVVVVLQDLTDPVLLRQIAEGARDWDHRIAVVVSDPGPTEWGDLLNAAVEVASGVTSVAECAERVDTFVRGEPLMTRGERDRLRETWIADLEHRRDVVNRVRSLSPQQRRVLDLLAEGRRVGEVAEAVAVTAGTVRSHVKTLRAKLGARSQLEAVAMLRRASMDEAAGIVPPAGSDSPDAFERMPRQ